MPVSWVAGSRSASSASMPPAAWTGSIWAGSPTSTSFAPAAAVVAVSRSRSCVPTIEASSTTSTVRGVGAQAAHRAGAAAGSRSCSYSHFATVSAGTRVLADSSAAARAEGASPTTR
jgi:hypothetical protein